MPVRARNRPLAPNGAAESILDFDAQMGSRDARENHRREQAHEHMTNLPESERAAVFVAEKKWWQPSIWTKHPTSTQIVVPHPSFHVPRRKRSARAGGIAQRPMLFKYRRLRPWQNSIQRRGRFSHDYISK